MFAEHPVVRAVIYGLAIAAQIAAVFIRLYAPDLADAFGAAAVILASVAGVQALTNLSPTYITVDGEQIGKHVRESGLDG